MESTANNVVWPQDASYWYSMWSLGSFICVLALNHWIAPLYFENQPNSHYQLLTPRKKMEWTSRVGSSVHAAVVSSLSFISLIIEWRQWIEPITTIPRIGSISLAISIGYMFADSISMITFQKGLELVLFTIHHIIVAICFGFLLTYRVAPNYGILRLTSEMSTPFLNQRWFLKTIGGDSNDRKIAKITLMFSACFLFGRYFLTIPYWYIFVRNFNSPVHLAIKSHLPASTNFFIMCPAALDCINIVWGIPVLAITKKAIKTLSTLDRSPKTEPPAKSNLTVSNGNSFLSEGDKLLSDMKKLE